MTPKSTLLAIAEAFAVQDGNLRAYIAERRAASISATRLGVTSSGNLAMAGMGGNKRAPISDIPDYLTKAEDLARALEAKGFAIVERERVA